MRNCVSLGTKLLWGRGPCGKLGKFAFFMLIDHGDDRSLVDCVIDHFSVVSALETSHNFRR